MNKFKIAGIVVMVVAFSMLMHRWNKSSVVVEKEKVTSAVVDNTADASKPPLTEKASADVETKPSSSLVPATIVKTEIPQFKGWRSVLVSPEEEKLKDLSEGDTVTVRYIYTGHSDPKEVEMIPLGAKNKRQFTGVVIYDGTAGPEDIPLRLKFSSGQYSVFLKQDGMEVEQSLSGEEYQKLMATFNKVRVLPGEGSLAGYLEMEQTLVSTKVEINTKGEEK